MARIRSRTGTVKCCFGEQAPGLADQMARHPPAPEAFLARRARQLRHRLPRAV
jgi:hypothetical protein